MVTIPFNLLSHEGEIRFVDEKSIHGLCGQAHQCDMHIRIQEGLPEDVTGSTLFHELIHIIEFLTGTQFEESEVDCLALGFYSFLKENPHIRDLLFEEEEEQEDEESEYEYASYVNPYCSWQEGVYHNHSGSASLSGVLPNIDGTIVR